MRDIQATHNSHPARRGTAALIMLLVVSLIMGGVISAQDTPGDELPGDLRGLPQQPVTDSATPEPAPTIPDHFALISPADQTTLTNPANVTLTWRAHPKAAWYRARVEQMRQGKKPLVVVNHRLTEADLTTACVDNVCTLDLATLGVTLKDGKRYKWQVIVKRAGNKKLHKTPKARFTVDTSYDDGSTPEPTPTQTSPELQLLLHDDFENQHLSYYWNSSAYAARIEQHDSNFVLAGYAGSELMPRRIQFPLEDIVIESQVKVVGGTMGWFARRNEISAYGLIVTPDGHVQLFRDGQLITSVETGLPFAEQWQTLRFSLIDSSITVELNDERIIEFTDTNPLSGGEFIIQGYTEDNTSYLLDDVYIWSTQAEFGAATTFSLPQLQHLMDTPMTEASERIFTVVSTSTEDTLFSSKLDGTDVLLLADGSDSYAIEGVTISPDGSKIAYVPYEWGLGQIYILNADGSNQPHVLTNGGKPSWSPDSTKIAFTRFHDGYSRVFTINVDGTGETAITANTPVSFQTAYWSPDGLKIVAQTGAALWIMNADGSNAAPLASAAPYSGIVGDLYWSPDSLHIAYTLYTNTSNPYSLHVAHVAGGSTQITDPNFEDPDPDADREGWVVFPHASPWSSGSTTLFYKQEYTYGIPGNPQASHYDIFSVSVTGSSSSRLNLTDTPGGIDIDGSTYRLNEELYSLSPDHTQALHSIKVYGAAPSGALPDPGVYRNVLAFNSPSYARSNFASNVRFEAWAVVTPSSIPPIKIDTSSFDYSMVFEGDSALEATTDIYYREDDNSPLVNITNSPDSNQTHPTLSPDGSQVVYQSDQSGNWDIFVRDISGQNEQLIAQDGQYPIWSPDGTRVAFVRDSAVQAVYVLGTPDEHVLHDHQTGEIRDLAWSSDGRWIVYAYQNALYYVNAGCTEVSTFLCDSYRLTPEDDLRTFQHPVWSPDSNQLAAVIDGKLYAAEVPYNDAVQPYAPADISIVAEWEWELIHSIPEGSVDGRPSWSPQADYLVFEATNEGVSAIYQIAVSEFGSSEVAEELVQYASAPSISPHVTCPDPEDDDYLLDTNPNPYIRKACFLENRGSLYAVIHHEGRGAISISEIPVYLAIHGVSDPYLSSYPRDFTYHPLYLYAKVALAGLVWYAEDSRDPDPTNYIAKNFSCTSQIRDCWAGLPVHSVNPNEDEPESFTFTSNSDQGVTTFKDDEIQAKDENGNPILQGGEPIYHEIFDKNPGWLRGKITSISCNRHLDLDVYVACVDRQFYNDLINVRFLINDREKSYYRSTINYIIMAIDDIVFNRFDPLYGGQAARTANGCTYDPDNSWLCVKNTSFVMSTSLVEYSNVSSGFMAHQDKAYARSFNELAPFTPQPLDQYPARLTIGVNEGGNGTRFGGTTAGTLYVTYLEVRDEHSSGLGIIALNDMKWVTASFELTEATPSMPGRSTKVGWPQDRVPWIPDCTLKFDVLIPELMEPSASPCQ